MTPGRRLVTVVVAVVLLGSLVVPASAPAASASDGGAGAGGADAASAPVPAARATPADNETRHENPEEVDEEGDLGAVESWLAGRLGGRLEDSTIQLSQGEYDLARSLVGDAYRDRYGQYVDVAGETGTARDDRAAEAFERGRQQQETFVDQVREYRETREEYEEARADGDEDRARRLARELDRQAGAIDETGEGLERSYRIISNRTDADMADGIEAIEEIRANVSAQRAEIREETFVATRLSLEVASERVSFSEPLAATGRLVTEDGDPVADRTVRIAVGGRTVEATTDDEGRFALTYRPTTLPVGEQSVTVAYVPRNASAYLGDATTVRVTVVQEQPSVRLGVAEDAVAYGDEVAVSGSVAVDDVGAGGVPVVVFLGDRRVGAVRTGGNGSFDLASAVPKDVRAGERAVRAEIPLEDRALAGASANRTVTVETTATALAIDEASVEGDHLSIAGTLTTTDGDGVGDARVGLRLGDLELSTVRTGEGGRFEATLAIPRRLRPAEGTATVELLAAFAGSGTNLQGSTASAPVRLRAVRGGGEPAGDGDAGGDDDAGGDGDADDGDADGDGGSDSIGLPPGGDDGLALPVSLPALAGLGAAVALAAVLVTVARRRRRSRASESGSKGSATSDAPDADSTDDAGEAPLVAAARQHVDAGRSDDAVEAAYAAARAGLASSLAVPGAATHWEFLGACRNAGLNGSRLDDLEALTSTYERAAFAPASVSVESAREAVAVASRVTDGAEPGG